MMLSYLMSIYSGTIIIRCLYYKPGQRLHDYKAVGTAAFGWVGYSVASVLHLLNLFGCPALYLVLAASNLNSLLHNTVSFLYKKNFFFILTHNDHLDRVLHLILPPGHVLLVLSC